MLVRLCAPEYPTCISPLNSFSTFLPLPWPILLLPPKKNPPAPSTLSDSESFFKCSRSFLSLDDHVTVLIVCCSLGIYIFPWFTLIFYVYVTPPQLECTSFKALKPQPLPLPCLWQEHKFWPTLLRLHGPLQPGEGSHSETQWSPAHECLAVAHKPAGFNLFLKFTSEKVEEVDHLNIFQGFFPCVSTLPSH